MTTLTDLQSAGFDVQAKNHARAIMDRDFPTALSELCTILAEVKIPDIELIRGGGGESPLTQRIRRALTDAGWAKRSIEVRKVVDDVETALRHTRLTMCGRATADR